MKGDDASINELAAALEPAELTRLSITIAGSYAWSCGVEQTENPYTNPDWAAAWRLGWLFAETLCDAEHEPDEPDSEPDIVI